MGVGGCAYVRMSACVYGYVCWYGRTFLGLCTCVYDCKVMTH